MSRTFYLTNSASDLSSGGADFDNKMVETTGTAGTLTVSVAKGATEVSYFFTEPGIPGTYGVENSTGYELTLVVPTGSSSMNCMPALWRVNSSGTPQLGGAEPYPNPVTLTSGTHVFTWSSPVSFDPWNAGDRLRVTMTFTNLATHAVTSIDITVNDSSSKMVTPFNVPAALIVPTQFVWL